MKWAPWIIVIYMLSAICWWTYLLYSKNEIIYNQQMAIFQFQEAPDQLMMESVKSNHIRQRTMIIGEGMVFGAALICGVFYLWVGYRKNLKNTERQNNFLLSVTHELKSPLASIKLAFETIKKRSLKPEQNQQISENGIKEADRLHLQIENILTATSIDQRYSAQKTTVNIGEMFQGIIDKRKNTPGVERVQYELIQSDEGKQEIIVDVLGVYKICENLIENALKYSSDIVQMQMEIEDNILRIKVTDKGPGIPVHEKKLIFQRFYRVGNEETRSSKGTGLGLFIVKQIAEKNKGRVKIEDNKPNGSIFITELKII